MDKKGQLKWGSLDILSAILFLVGIYLTQTNYQTIGWILIGLAILKQFSGK